MTHGEVVTLLNMLKEHKELEMVKITDLDIIYNPHMNDGNGEWEVFDSYGDHTQYAAFDNADALAELILEYM